MINISYPYTYGDVRETNYEVELVKKTVDFRKGTVHKKYRIVQIISNCKGVRRIIIGFFTVIIALGLIFGSSSSVEPIIQPKTPIETQLKYSRSTQADQAMEGSESSSARNILQISWGDLSKPSNPGIRAFCDY